MSDIGDIGRILCMPNRGRLAGYDKDFAVTWVIWCVAIFGAR